ncbi:MAG: hypothetical protein HOW73_45985 [Polyangiaceae bacterium]|nr:hypothetical protein [Polyangiaceae bacterium]
MWTKGQGVQAADAAITSYRTQIAELESEYASVVSDHRVVLTQLQDSLDQAARLVLPDAAPATLASAAHELRMTWLPARRAELEHKRGEWKTRLAQIERDAYFVRRQALLHATRGEIAIERQHLQTVLADIERRRAHFDNETLRWVKARTTEQQLDRGALGSFWDAVTFSGYRVDRAKARCAKELGFDTYEAVASSYDAVEIEHAQVQQRLHRNEALRQGLLSMLEEHAKLYTWTTEFEPRICDMLRGEVRNALAKLDLRNVHGSIRPEARVLVAQAHALLKKAEYLSNLQGFLKNQIDDRNGRIHAISKTRVAWAMKPWDRVSGNKMNWLVGLPASKKQSTHKQVRFARRMHHNIIEFEDYDDYSYYLDNDPDFLPYDAFAYGSDEPMPYEGFSRVVVPDLARYRAQHEQDKADYGFFRSMDKQAAAEERAAAREAAREAQREAQREASLEAEAERREVATDDGGGGFWTGEAEAPETDADAGLGGDDAGADDTSGDDAGADDTSGDDAGAEDMSDAEAGIEADESGADTEDSS